MRFGWFPLRNIIRWTAKRHGFLDPLSLIARLEGFGQPAEVAQPIELLRAGVVLHARGLINARVIQHNLDWIWPWWVERQFDPRDVSFIPRAFSITHVNLTHRNWTALGLPGIDRYPLVDPRGLLTPHFDGWSLDVWLLGEDGIELIPSRESACQQVLDLSAGLVVETQLDKTQLALCTRAEMSVRDRGVVVGLSIEAVAPPGTQLILAVRPYNPEGVSFIERIDVSKEGDRWQINDETSFILDRPPERVWLSRYTQGDVYSLISKRAHERSRGSANEQESLTMTCPVGMASGAALFPITQEPLRVNVEVELGELKPPGRGGRSKEGFHLTQPNWAETLKCASVYTLGSEKLDYLCCVAARTLVLLSPADIFPGPYTYRRFWFRDACLMIQGLLAAGIPLPAERCIDRFEQRQTEEGYLYSQEGEWDSNGLVLWAIELYCVSVNRCLKPEWMHLVRLGAEWILMKRLPSDGDARHRGLLPAGFSAEHLGPNDFYFWDDFWGIGGLESAARLFRGENRPSTAERYRRAAHEFRTEVLRAIGEVSAEFGERAIPASPYRRLDAGAIGSLACAYPLHILSPEDPALSATVDFLWGECCIDGAFFQDMIHSGLNPYLSLHLAQILRRRNDPRAQSIFDRVAALATSTGQWPEAIHPHTGGGCMGDGQHGWAAAEFITYVRMMFVAEEGEELLLCSGIPLDWLSPGKRYTAQRVLTRFGVVSLTIECESQVVNIAFVGEWYGEPPIVRVRFLGGDTVLCSRDQRHLELPYLSLKRAINPESA